MKPYPSFEAPNKQHWLPTDPDLDTFKDIELPDEKEKKRQKSDSDEKKKEIKTQANDAEHKKDKKKHGDTEKQKSGHAKIEKIKQKDEESYEEKQEKRQHLIERSLQYKKLYEEVPVPRDSAVLAKLLVAEHILALHEQIEKPKKNAVLSKEELLDAFDYMGELSEKFEKPEEESPPEIQEAYENLLFLAQEALGQNTEPALIVEANQEHAARPAGASPESHHQKPSQPDTPDIETPKPMTLPKATLALVSALLVMRTPKTKPSAAPLSPSMPAPFSSEQVKKAPVPEVHAPSYPDSEQAPAQQQTTTTLRPSLSPIEARQAYREATRAEHRALHPLRPGEKIAAIAVAAAFTPAPHHEHPAPILSPVSDAREYSSFPSYTAPAPHHAELTSITYSHAKPVTSHAETVHSYISSTPYKRPETPTAGPIFTETLSKQSVPLSPVEINEQRSSRKIEHLPLQTLLVMAESVPIGHGQRLRRAYEKGEIDKDGLIKVLKSRSKNLDFVREFKQQSDRHRMLIQASPEFLSAAKNNPRTSPDAPETLAQPQLLQDAHTGTATPSPHLSESKEQLLNDVLSPRQKQAEETPTGWKTILLIAGGVIVAVGLIIALFMLK